MDVDTVLTEAIGEFGRSQKRTFVLLNVLSFSAFCQWLLVVFVAATPQWTCPHSSNPTRLCVSSLEGCCNSDRSVCSMAVFVSNFTSIATEWSLVCDRTYKNDLVQSFYMAGSLFGAPLFGRLADKYGRKRIWIATFITGSVASALSAFSTSYDVFLVLRSLTGFLVGGCTLVTFVYATESVGPAYRGFVGTLQPMFFSVSIAFLGVLAYLIRDWRMLTLATVIPSAIGPFCFYLLPKSPRWLASQGRTEEAEAVLQEMFIDNGCRSNRPITLKIASYSGNSLQSRTNGILDLFSHTSMCLITVILIVSWFVNSFVYYGLSLNIKNLGGNVYGNFIFAGLVEIPSYALAMLLISYLGRRKTLFCFMMGAMATCYTCMKLQETNYNSMLLSMAAMTGKFCISASFAVIYVYSAELFPTAVRTVGMGVASMAARLGGVASPFVVLLGEQNRSLPMFMFTVAAAGAGIIGLKLPETKGQPMPETIEDVDKLSRGAAVKGISQI